MGVIPQTQFLVLQLILAPSGSNPVLSISHHFLHQRWVATEARRRWRRFLPEKTPAASHVSILDGKDPWKKVMEIIVQKNYKKLANSSTCVSFPSLFILFPGPLGPLGYFFCRLEAPAKISEEVSKAETATEVREFLGFFSLSCMGVVR